jgi:transposase InsO family protein
MQRKLAVEMVASMGLSGRKRVCRLLRLSRSSAHSQDAPSAVGLAIDGSVEEVSREWLCLGDKKVTSILRNEHGRVVNPKRMARVRRQRGLLASRKGSKRPRLAPKQEQRRGASRANEVWSYDFISDATANGRSVRILSVIDEYTRECIVLRGARSFPARKVLEVLEEVIERTGRGPGYLRSNNGPEFVARVVRRWVEKAGIQACYIEPGAPWENGHVESFHAQLRAELLDRELYLEMQEINPSLENWQESYNYQRLHGSLGNLPHLVAAQREIPLRPPAYAPVHAGKLTRTRSTKKPPTD